MASAPSITPLTASILPEETWEVHDDLCDCTFQRIGEWTNPYMGETMRVRLCCVWKEMEKEWPQFFQHTHAFWDYNQDEWVAATREWDGEDDMERAVWYRQMANEQGLPLEVIRERYRLEEPPKGTPRPKQEEQLPVASVTNDIYQAYGELYAEMKNLRAGLQVAIGTLQQVCEGSLARERIEFHEHGFTITEEDSDGSNTDA